MCANHSSVNALSSCNCNQEVDNFMNFIVFNYRLIAPGTRLRPDQTLCRTMFSITHPYTVRPTRVCLLLLRLRPHGSPFSHSQKRTLGLKLREIKNIKPITIKSITRSQKIHHRNSHDAVRFTTALWLAVGAFPHCAAYTEHGTGDTGP